MPLPESTLLFRGLWQWHELCGFCGFEPGRLCLWPFNDATCGDKGVLAHVSMGESFSGLVCDPITELVVTRHEKADPLAVKGMVFGEIGVAAVLVMREVLGLWSISQEEGISPFLRSQFRPVYR